MSRRRIRRAALVACALLAILLLPRPLTTEAAPPLGAPLTPGTNAVVRADGECLRVRFQPGLESRTISCVPEGTLVAVLPSAQLADGYRWQLITVGTLTGWAADAYLQPTAAAATTAACAPGMQPTAIKPGLTGFVPSAGGAGLVIWGGGSLSGIDNAATAKGCRLSAIWTSRPDGEMVAYLPGAPAFVNEPWRRAFPADRLGGGQVLMILCDSPDTVRAASVRVPLPQFNAPPPVFVGPTAGPKIEARAAVVIDEASGAILYGIDPHRSLPPASLTKIATAIVAIEGTDLYSWVATNVDSRQLIGSSVVGLVPGDCFTVTDLLYGLMLPSGNDAARALARYQSGTEDSFVFLMNTLAGRLGLKGSNFTDADGLGSARHVMSAHDIAILSRYAMTLPAFRDVVDTPSWTARGGRALPMTNVNAFLRTYAGADGIKTGYTEEAGSTLAVSATRNGHRIYAVLLNDDQRYTDAKALMDWAFASHRWP